MVAAAPLLLLVLELVPAAADELGLELLEPQAATPAATTIEVATALMRRYVNFISLIR